MQEPGLAAYMGCIGDDAFGMRLRETCEADGVVTRPGMYITCTQTRMLKHMHA